MDVTDPRWYRLLHASRWPLAVVLASWALAVAVTQVLRQPIPIGLPLSQPLPVRLEGAIKVDRILQPIVVGGKEPLPVVAVVDVQNKKPIPVDDVRVSVQAPVRVEAQQALPVQASQPLPVMGNVEVDAINEAVPIATEEPIGVTGKVGVNELSKAVKVSVSGALKSLNPFNDKK